MSSSALALRDGRGGQGAAEVADMLSELLALLSAMGAAASLGVRSCLGRGEVTTPHLDVVLLTVEKLIVDGAGIHGQAAAPAQRLLRPSS